MNDGDEPQFGVRSDKLTKALRTRRPNFLLITTDQQRWDHVGYAGNTELKTPNTDLLAREGSWFSSFFVASPTCMSNRAALMTGRMPSLNGVRYNGVPLGLDAVTFVDLLSAAGYRTSLVGKCHLQGMTAEPAYVPRTEFAGHLQPPPPELAEARRSAYPEERYRSEMRQLWRASKGMGPPIVLPYYGFSSVDFCVGHADKVTGHYESWLRERAPELAECHGWDHAIEHGTTGLEQVYKPALPEDIYPTSYIRDKTIAVLDEASRHPSEPFFIHCSFPDPHHPFTPPGRYWDMYDPQQVALPADFAVSPPDLIPPERVLWDDFLSDRKLERWSFPYVANAEQVREVIARTYGQITMIDDAIGAIMRHVHALGIAGDTVICFLSDHGDYLGQHGLLGKGPMHYQSIIRTPFVWRDCEPAYNRGRIDALASTLDIAQTILFRAGLQPCNGMQGVSLLPMLSGEASQGRSGILIEQTTAYPYLGFEDLVTVHTVVTDRWRLSVWSGQRWGELYDMSLDPGETNNLWDSPEHRDVKQALLLELIQLLQSHGEVSPYPLSVS